MEQKIRMKAEIERWRQSGLTQKEVSQQLGIKVATFAYWVSRSKEEDKTGFVPLRPGQGDLAGEIEITYPNGVCLKYPHPIRASFAGSLICINVQPELLSPVLSISRVLRYAQEF